MTKTARLGTRGTQSLCLVGYMLWALWVSVYIREELVLQSDSADFFGGRLIMYCNVCGLGSTP